MIFDQFEDRVLLDPIPLVLVLLGFDAAGGIHQCASRIQIGYDGREDVLLNFRNPADLDGHWSVAGFHPSCEDA